MSTTKVRAFIAALRESLEGEVRHDDVARAAYATDASVYQILPTAVAIPRSTDDLQRIVATCREHGVSITARGGGTSQAGQAVGSGLQVDFSKHLNAILELEPNAKRVRVQPGLVLDELNRFLKPYNLELPLDLSTANRATIGGMISNNSAGTRSVLYGKTIDYVESLRVLLHDGQVVELRELAPDDWAAKTREQTAEGHCYSEIDRLGQTHADEIVRRYPRILRRVGGYNLDEFTDRGARRNLARMMVGAEGTLGLVVDATLRLVERPQFRAVGLLHFGDLVESLAATPALLDYSPSAIELVDRFILDTTRDRPEYAELRSILIGDPAAVLILEFLGKTQAEADQRLSDCRRSFRHSHPNVDVVQAGSVAEQGRIWGLRRAALGLSMSQRGDTKSASFVEDTAVSPEKLSEYIARFLKILERHETQAGFYAHASVGLLHIRPVINLKTTDGVARFAGIADEVADLVLEFGGALSGEHGDGLVRSPFQERMFGSILYAAFREVKQAFDPHGLFNPGKIVDAPALTDNLRSFLPNAESAKATEILTAFDFGDFGGIERAAEQCGGIGACRKQHAGTMCPSFVVTQDEIQSTRGRANVLRNVLAGTVDIAWNDSNLEEALDLCLECKACRTECPTGVDLARLKSEALHQRHETHGVSWKTWLIGRMASAVRFGSRHRWMANAIGQSRLGRLVAQYALGLDRRRELPRFVKPLTNESTVNCDSADVAVFADTWTSAFEPQIPGAVVRLAEHLGQTVATINDQCCGRPLISKGLLKQAKAHAEATTRRLEPIARAERPILFCEPSCYSAVVDDHPRLVAPSLRSAAERVAGSCRTFEQWAAEQTVPSATSTGVKVALHTHCHVRALCGSDAGVRALKRWVGADIVDLDCGCCGMAGSFGYETSHYDISVQIANDRLLPTMAGLEPGTMIAATGFSCRHQLADLSSTDARSIPEIIEQILRATTRRGRSLD